MTADHSDALAMSERHHRARTRSVSRSRRAFLALTTGSLAALAGCSYEQRRDPDTGNARAATEDADGTDSGTATETPEPSTVDAFAAALEQKGIRVDSTMTMMGGVSVMYYREPERHRAQLDTVASTFTAHRTIVSSNSLLSVTALSSNTDRHGVADIPRPWADQHASGALADSEYVQRVLDSYRTV